MSDITMVYCYNNEKIYHDFVSTLRAQSYFIKMTCETQRIGFVYLSPCLVYLWLHSMAGVIFRKLGIYEVMKKILH